MRAVFIGCLWVLAQLAAAQTGEDAVKWLQRMAVAVKSLNYQGTFVYIHHKQIEAMRIIHKVDAGGERERLLSLNGAAREIIRDQNRLTCILPDKKSVVVEKSRTRKIVPEALLQSLPALQQHYFFKIVGEGRIAGMQTKIIAVVPKDRYRYGHRLWLDKKTAMLLKSDVIDIKGNIIEQLMFTDLKIVDHIDDKALQPSAPKTGFKLYQQLKKPVVQQAPRHWKIGRLPPGYKLKMYAEHGLPTSRMPVDHYVYTDGLSSVSVYIEKPGKKKKMPLRGLSRMGAVNAFGKVVKGYQITVVGEVPAATVKLIGKSVRMLSEPAD